MAGRAITQAPKKHVEIRVNDKDFLEDFIRLNEEWISKYFEIEPIDKALFSALYQVVENGGYLFTVVSGGKAVGVCALFKESAEKYELARMAVAPTHQGQGIGDLLIHTCLSTLKRIGAQTVYLVSNTKLEPAISLYQKHGFQTTSLAQHPVYARANITMERSVY